MSERNCIIAIDPEESIRDLLQEYFSELGYRMYPAASIPEGLELISAGAASVVLLDAGMLSGDSAHAIDQLKQADPGLRVILITGYPSLDGIVKAFRHGAFDVIVKPFRLADLSAVVDRALRPMYDEIIVEKLKNRVNLLENLLSQNSIPAPDESLTADSLNQKNSNQGPESGPEQTSLCLTAGSRLRE